MALTDNLVSYYKLDWNSNDSVGSNNGTDTSVSYVSGKIGNAGSYNGSTSYSTMGNVLDQTGSNAFSISLWIKYSSTGNDMLVTKQLSSGNFTWYALWRNNTAWKIEFTIVSTASNLLVVHFPDDYNDWNWHHIGITYNGSKSTSWCVWYIDGNAVTLTSVTNSLTGSSTSTAPFNLGSRNNWNLPTNWLIDEVWIWNRAITATEVSTLYNGWTWLSYPFSLNNPAFFLNLL